jgi:hypothetical protein
MRAKLLIGTACAAGLLMQAAMAASPKHVSKPAAQSPKCASLASGLDVSVKSAALDNATGQGNAAAAQTEIANKLALMKSFSCKPYSGHISPRAYYLPALECSTALTTWVTDQRFGRDPEASKAIAAEKEAKCRMSQWEALPID